MQLKIFEQNKEIMLHALHSAMHRLKSERSVSEFTQISILDPGAVPRKSQLRRLDYKIANLHILLDHNWESLIDDTNYILPVNLHILLVRHPDLRKAGSNTT